MNRQTLAVTFGTLALVVIGAILLYASPTPQGNRAVPRPQAAADKGKAPEAKSRGTLGEEKLVHESPVPEDRPAAPESAPNVVVVFASTLRRDQLTPWGGPDETTPYLAERAAAGVAFDDALAVAVDPRATAAALTTGRYPHAVGMIERSKRRNMRAVDHDATTLAESFQEAGWYTMGLTANHNLNARAGQLQGFDWVRESQPYGFMLDRRIQAPELVERTLAAVDARSEARGERPLYLQVAFIDNHKPFRVPPDEFRQFEGPDHDIAPYRAVLRRVDDQVKRLVEGLAERGLTDDDTVFLFVADHGEGLMMPPHHRRQHGRVLYPSIVQIPWLVWGAGVAEGARIAGLASQIDVAPTVRALAGVPVGEVDGMDLSAAVRGERAETGRERAYADTFFEGVDRASIWTDTHQCQKDYGSEGVKDTTFEEGCFDRQADPTFLQPTENAALMAELESMRSERMAELEK